MKLYINFVFQEPPMHRISLNPILLPDTSGASGNWEPTYCDAWRRSGTGRIEKAGMEWTCYFPENPEIPGIYFYLIQLEKVHFLNNINKYWLIIYGALIMFTL
jgi:hypothetical protein